MASRPLHLADQAQPASKIPVQVVAFDLVQVRTALVGNLIHAFDPDLSKDNDSTGYWGPFRTRSVRFQEEPVISREDLLVTAQGIH